MAVDPSEKNLNANLKVAGFALLGIIIFVLHIGIFFINQYMFSIIISVYVLVYAILVFIVITKNTDCFSKSVFNLTVNFSIYTILLQIMLIVFTIFMYSRKKN